MSDKMPGLLPCPFCGGAPTEYDQIAYSSVKCIPCGFSIKRKAEDGAPYAQDLWNRRAAALPPGFVAVPVEPTHEMLEAMREKHWEIRGCQLCAHDYRDVHAAMLAARPEVK